MEEKVKDIAFETLLEVAKTSAPELPESLLRQVYAIQHSHQFDRDRDSSLQEMQRLLDQFVDLSTGSGGVAE